jgi:adenine-specific DNA-methyltransferase
LSLLHIKNQIKKAKLALYKFYIRISMPTLQFKGKNIIWNHHLSVPYHILEEVEDLHFQPEKGNGNLIIEGDNLIALKALLPEYAGKIDIIYIDPPYNTGKEGWVYNDNVNSPLINHWLGKVVGSDDLTKHDKWLCMMTPRLKLLRDLLADDGLIFISIDDYEYHNLRILMDEIFGEENFIENYIWESTFRPDNSSKIERENGQYVLAFSKNKKKITQLIGDVSGSDGLPSLTKNTMKESTLTFEKGKVTFFIEDGHYKKGVLKSKYELLDDVEIVEGKNVSDFRLKGRMIWGQDYLKKELENGTEIIIKTDGFIPYSKKIEDSILPPNTILPKLKVGDVLQGRAEVTQIFGFAKFEHPKPTSLIKYLIGLKGDASSVILDSFGGSGSTMHAVIDQNNLEPASGNRRCITIQMKEDSEVEPDKNICQNITRERVKIAIEKYGYDSGFKYLKVGTAIDPEKMLEGQLPTYEQFAKYIYFLGTGEHLADAQNINIKNHFVGTHGAKAFFLIYEQDFETLTRLALNLSIAEDIMKNSPNKRRVIYAPACFLDSEYMEEKQIEFVSIPYNLFERQTN